jgi:protein-L-isoaspartate(D-aspartate) O-methyltransferase
MSAELDRARENMVEAQVRTADVTNVAIQDALRAADRHQLVPGPKSLLAYTDIEIEYAPGRWLLKPRDVAKLLQAIQPLKGETALALSAPYAAMVLRLMDLEVTEADAAQAPAGGGFDVLICEGAVEAAPRAWLDLLKVGGRLGVVERNGPVGRATVYLRSAEDVGRREFFDATPPYLEGFSPQPRFAF